MSEPMYNRASAGSQSAREIVVALVVDADRVLVQPRVGDRAMRGLWEFPGGKVGPGESRAAALVREVREESGFDVAVVAPLVAFSHAYPDRRVSLHAYLCRVPGPRPETGRWVTLDEARSLPMPAANPPLFDALAWRIGYRLAP